MNRTEFKNIYEQAQKVDILNNDWFNAMGWFWLNLTERQANKMIDLIIEQNNFPRETKVVTFRNGMKLRKVN